MKHHCIGNTFITVHSGKRYTTIDADYYPPLSGASAETATELVLRGARETLDAGRSRSFWIHVPGYAAQITRKQADKFLDYLRNKGSQSGSVFVAVVPTDRATEYLENFRALAR